MAKNDINIKVELDPIVRLTCLAHDCRYNLHLRGDGSFCNLKSILLGQNHKCVKFELNSKKESRVIGHYLTLREDAHE